MVQFNLLPDVKLQYVKARRTKYLITFLSTVIGGAALAILLFTLFFVKVVQQKSINDLNDDIKKYTVVLNETKDLDKMLTVQNQLGTLTSLHESKPVTSRVFTYLTQVTPAAVSLNQLTIDFSAGTMSVGGTAQSLESVKLYADTFKSATFTVEGSDTQKKAFDDVVLSSFSKNEKGATFTLTMTYDQALFDVSQNVTMVVPAQANTNQNGVFGTEAN